MSPSNGPSRHGVHFDPYRRNFAALSVRDLLDARDLYHVHLAHLGNVHATAVGRYLIRRKAVDARGPVSGEKVQQKRGKEGARRLDNSSMHPWSWPCVLVFVDEWLTPAQLNADAGQMVPPFLYLPDGRVVPVCTVEAPRDIARPPTPPDYRYSSQRIGGGYPVFSEVQGVTHLGTLACLVTDGIRHYALTNQHVTGEPGRTLSALIDGEPVEMGNAARSVGRKRFVEALPGLAGSNVVSNLDAGLIDLHDIRQCTSSLFGLGELGRMLSFDAESASLDWIGRQVVGHGARGGRMSGQIQALFYRYRSSAGQDSVTDFLIGAREGGTLASVPGDSGTLWCMDPSEYNERSGSAEARYRPFAMQWGGERWVSGEVPRSMVLGSSLSILCRELDVEIVADLNAQLTQYWGATGHYKIAQLAIDKVKSTALRGFLSNHLERISYSASTIASGIHGEDPTKFVPLADVPDYVWKTNMNRKKPALARAQENWNHYCDMDLPGKSGKTLDQLCGPNLDLDAAAWIAFYRTAPQPSASSSSARVNMGALPFRVWQVFDALVGYRKAGKQAEFLCAAGILAHYVGDACQPLHASMHSDGLDGATTHVHSLYEERMIDLKSDAIRSALDSFQYASLGAPKVTKIRNGYEAAQATVDLMRRVRKTLPPERICTLHQQFGGGASTGVAMKLWDEIGPQTVRCMADGLVTLARLWDAAYAVKSGAAFTASVSEKALQKIYENKTFLESKHLANWDPKVFEKPV